MLTNMHVLRSGSVLSSLICSYGLSRCQKGRAIGDKRTCCRKETVQVPFNRNLLHGGTIMDFVIHAF